MKSVVKKILSIADKTYYNWRNENRPIIKLLEKYFTKEDLEEFLRTGEISKLNDFINFSNSEEYRLFLEFLEFRKYKGK